MKGEVWVISSSLTASACSVNVPADICRSVYPSPRITMSMAAGFGGPGSSGWSRVVSPICWALVAKKHRQMMKEVPIRFIV